MTREYFRELAATFLTRSRTPYQLSNFVPPPFYRITPSNDVIRTRSERQRQRGVTDFRRNVYDLNLWVQDLVDITGRYRECTPQFYRENPAQIHRIIPWLNREVNALLNDNESQVAYVLDKIISSLTQHPIRSREFRDMVRPFFGRRTDHFIHEFYTFARSVYDIAGFDTHAVYAPDPYYSTEVQEISSSNDDSDVEVIGASNQRRSSAGNSDGRSARRKSARSGRKTANSAGEPIPGPSGINNLRPQETIELCESDADDVRVIEYVKPEPEVITLSSGDEQTQTSFSDNDNTDSTFPRIIQSKRNSQESKTSTRSTADEQNSLGKKTCKDRKKGCMKFKEDTYNFHRKRGKASHKSRKSDSYSSHSRSISSSSSSSGSSDSSISTGVTSSKSSRSNASSGSSSSCSSSSNRTVSNNDGSCRYATKSGNASATSASNSKDIGLRFVHYNPPSSSTQQTTDYSNAESASKKGSRRHRKKVKCVDVCDLTSHGKEGRSEGSSASESSKRKSKVKSCIVIPKYRETSREESTENSNACARNAGTSRDYSNIRDPYDAPSSNLPSYWSLALDNKGENHKKRKRSKERKPTCKRSKQGSPTSDSEGPLAGSEATDSNAKDFATSDSSGTDSDSEIDCGQADGSKQSRNSTTSTSKNTSVETKSDWWLYLDSPTK